LVVGSIAKVASKNLVENSVDDLETAPNLGEKTPATATAQSPAKRTSSSLTGKTNPRRHHLS
jgi:hypothetical protein